METHTANERLRSALQCAARGWPVLPVYEPVDGGGCSCRKGTECGSVGKHPRTKNGFRDATTDTAQIVEWWTTWPSANIGVPMGEVSGMFALDVDRRSGGLEALEALEAEHGPLPPTLVAHTGGGGKHFFFKYPDDGIPSTTICRGVEIKSDGTFVIVAPSQHASGAEYAWEDEGS